MVQPETILEPPLGRRCDEPVRALSRGTSISFVLHIALIPRFGMLGAAISTTVATLAWNVVLVADAWRQLQIDPTSWGRFAKSSSSSSGEGSALVVPGDSPCPDQTF